MTMVKFPWTTWSVEATLFRWPSLLTTPSTTGKLYSLPGLWCDVSISHIDGLVQERRNSIALAMELRLSCFNPSKWHARSLVWDTSISMSCHAFSQTVFKKFISANCFERSLLIPCVFLETFKWPWAKGSTNIWLVYKISKSKIAVNFGCQSQCSFLYY